MKFKICTDDNGSVDYFVVEGSIEEIQRIAQDEVEARGWKNYWSEEL